MGDAAERAPTFEELYEAVRALPEGLTGEILEPGVIRTMSRPAAAHRFTAHQVRNAFGDDDALDGSGRWWFESEAESRLGDRLAVPDLSAWRIEPNAEVPPDFIFVNPIAVVPDWCCEVLSPTTEEVDREIKLPLYATAGVGHVWLVDPIARRIEVYETRSGATALVETVAADGKRAVAPFNTVVDVSSFWLRRPKG